MFKCISFHEYSHRNYVYLHDMRKYRVSSSLCFMPHKEQCSSSAAWHNASCAFSFCKSAQLSAFSPECLFCNVFAYRHPNYLMHKLPWSSLVVLQHKNGCDDHCLVHNSRGGSWAYCNNVAQSVKLLPNPAGVDDSDCNRSRGQAGARSLHYCTASTPLRRNHTQMLGHLHWLCTLQECFCMVPQAAARPCWHGQLLQRPSSTSWQ